MYYLISNKVIIDKISTDLGANMLAEDRMKIDEILDVIENDLDNEHSPKEVNERLLSMVKIANLAEDGNTKNNVLLSLIDAVTDKNVENACAILRYLHNVSKKCDGEQYNLMFILMKQPGAMKTNSLYEILIRDLPSKFVKTYFEILEEIAPRISKKAYPLLVTKPDDKVAARSVYVSCNSSEDISVFEVALLSTASKWLRYFSLLERALNDAIKEKTPGFKLRLEKKHYPSISRVMLYGDVNTLMRYLEALSDLSKKYLLPDWLHMDIIGEALANDAKVLRILICRNNLASLAKVKLYHDYVRSPENLCWKLSKHLFFISPRLNILNMKVDSFQWAMYPDCRPRSLELGKYSRNRNNFLASLSQQEDQSSKVDQGNEHQYLSDSTRVNASI